MGFNITECSPIPTIGDPVPQTPAGSGTNTPILTSTPRPNGESCLYPSGLIQQNTQMFSSFTGEVLFRN